MAAQFSVTAFVLHRRPYRETSFLTTFFSETEGKFNAVVKGVRPSRGRSKSSTQKLAWLQPFQPLLLSWQEKENALSELVALRQFEPAESYSQYQALAGEAKICALYMNELLYRLLYPRVAVEGVFAAYQTHLQQLSDIPDNNRQQMSWILRQFELQLLQEMGLGLNLEWDLEQQPIQAGRRYFYLHEQGLVAESQFQAWQAEVLQNNLASAAIPVSGRCLIALQNGSFCSACLAEWKAFFRQILRLYLGNQPLYTRQLFQ